MNCSCSFCESLPPGENRKSSVRRPAGFAIPPPSCKTYRKKRVAYRLVFQCYLKKYSLLCLIFNASKNDNKRNGFKK